MDFIDLSSCWMFPRSLSPAIVILVVASAKNGLFVKEVNGRVGGRVGSLFRGSRNGEPLSVLRGALVNGARPRKCQRTPPKWLICWFQSCDEIHSTSPEHPRGTGASHPLGGTRL